MFGDTLLVAIPFVISMIGVDGLTPESGAKASTWIKSTATPQSVYTDSGLTVPATNPVIANSLGVFSFYLDSTLNYTIQIKTADSANILLQVDYTASGSVFAVTSATVPNYNALQAALAEYVAALADLDIDASWALIIGAPAGDGWDDTLAGPGPRRRIYVTNQTEFDAACETLSATSSNYGGIIEWVARGAIDVDEPLVVPVAFNGESRIRVVSDKGLLFRTTATFPTGRGVFETAAAVTEFEGLHIGNYEAVANVYGVRFMASSQILDDQTRSCQVRNVDIRLCAQAIRNENASKLGISGVYSNSNDYVYFSTNGGMNLHVEDVFYQGGYLASFAQTDPGWASEGRTFSNIEGVATEGGVIIGGGGFYDFDNILIDITGDGGTFEVNAEQTLPIQQINIDNFWSGGSATSSFIRATGPISSFRVGKGGYSNHGAGGIVIDGSARADVGNTYSAPAVQSLIIAGAKGENNSVDLDLQGVRGQYIGGELASTVALNERDDNVRMDYVGVTIGGSITRLSASSTMYVRFGSGSLLGPLPRNYIEGFELSNNGSDAVNDIDIAEGATRDSSNRLNLIGSAITKRLDAAWAAGTGNGGLDTGSIANATYHVFAILKTSDQSVDVLFSLSATAPTLPTGYLRFRRIGSIIRSGGTILGFTQRRNEFLLTTTVLDVNVSSPGTGYDLRALTVPGGIKVGALVAATLYDATASANTELALLSPDQGNAPLISAYIIANTGTATSANGGGEIRTNISSQIKTHLSASTADHGLVIYTRGWVDDRV